MQPLNYTLIINIIKLPSSYVLFRAELIFLQNSCTDFHNNGFSLKYISSIVKKLLTLQYRKESLVTTVSNQTVHAQLPFIGIASTQLHKELLDILGKFNFQNSPMFYFRQNCTVE